MKKRKVGKNTIAARIFIAVILYSFLLPYVFVSPVSANNASYYISTTGNDSNPGTYAQPWRTIQKAANLVSTGDTVYVRGGTYFEEVKIQNKHGTNDSWITFMPYNNEEVIVDGRYIPNSWGHAIFRTTDVSYIRITGFKVYNSARCGFWINCRANHICIDYNEIYNCSGNGIYTGTEELYTITNISFEYNVVDFVNNNWSGDGGFSSEGVSFRTVQFFTINNNRISRCGKECIDVKHGSSNGAVHHNSIDTSTWPQDPCYDSGNPWGHLGIYCDSFSDRNHDIDIYNNYIYGDHGSGIVVGVEQTTGSLDNVRIFNNVINLTWISTGIGIVNWGLIQGEPISNVSIYSNTVKTKGGCAFAIGGNNILGGVIVKNNIFTSEAYHVIKIWYYPHTTTRIMLSNNLFYRFSGIAHNRWMDGEDLSWGDNPQLGDPLFTSNFRLTKGSPAIDNGAVVPLSFDFDDNARLQGNDYDIGAYEFVISPPVWDVNENGVCNVYDFICISNHLGQLGTPGWIREDVDNNGAITMEDLIFVSIHYAKAWG